ncbi:MAG: chemotaxis response regulator protein-glutamate methylesterase [Spirochaetales bacterium]|uniref:Protein-glutamate methylesterase/protein-glutamine glutaminase n=1 Tax=Candidatus Thalassospirochaeta sargassi TaxID=3119039 RepID=A0AAJ1IB67_9SPIO|nr:chemotaxis response regulator protein-glutamate methylesterase [Spirochaetales bacterium]
MSHNDISVLVCDDSALMRNLIGRIIENADGLSLAGKAMNGRFALEKIPKLKPDIIMLDLEMPEMNGIEFLKEKKKRGIEIPVVILSSVAKKGAEVTMEAISLGASDFIMKPSDTNTLDLDEIAESIVKTLIAYGKNYKGEEWTSAKAKRADAGRAKAIDVKSGTQSKPAPAAPVKRPATFVQPSGTRVRTKMVELVVIGISTGGPNALREVFRDIDSELRVPVLVVQHMPAGFTEEFARSLDRICPLEVKEAANGDILKPGRVLIAPGSAHIKIERKKLATIIKLDESDPVNGHRPSADVLFSSAAETYGGNVLGVIMTGMGKDGARHLGTLYNKGAVTIGQDEESSIVYGMPKVAYEAGYVDYQLPLKEIAGKISEIVKELS